MTKKTKKGFRGSARQSSAAAKEIGKRPATEESSRQRVVQEVLVKPHSFAQFSMPDLAQAFARHTVLHLQGFFQTQALEKESSFLRAHETSEGAFLVSPELRNVQTQLQQMAAALVGCDEERPALVTAPLQSVRVKPGKAVELRCGAGDIGSHSRATSVLCYLSLSDARVTYTGLNWRTSKSVRVKTQHMTSCVVGRGDVVFSAWGVKLSQAQAFEEEGVGLVIEYLDRSQRNV